MQRVLQGDYPGVNQNGDLRLRQVRGHPVRDRIETDDEGVRSHFSEIPPHRAGNYHVPVAEKIIEGARLNEQKVQTRFVCIHEKTRNGRAPWRAISNGLRQTGISASAFFHSIDDGPRHVPMGFTSGLIVDDDFHYRKPIMYHYIGHISKYIAPGAKRIGWSKYGANLDVTAAVNPDGSYVVILLNRTKEDSGCFLRVNGHIMRVDLPAETLSTVVIEK